MERLPRRARRIITIANGKPCESLVGWQRNLRRRRQQQRGGEMDDGADDAIGVAKPVMVVVVRRNRSIGAWAVTLGGCSRREILGVDMAEGQDELQSKREQREPPAKPSLCPNPTHRHRPACGMASSRTLKM